MKSNIVLFYLLAFGFQSVVNAQAWFQEGKIWVYSWYQWGKEGYEELTVAPNDTIVNGVTCKILNSHLHYRYFNSNTSTYIITDEYSLPRMVYESGDQVYFLSYDGEWILQYDFSLEPGDSIIYSYINEPKYKLLLDSVGTTMVGSQSLRTQYFTAFLLTGIASPSYDGNHFTMMEGIGMVASNSANNQGSFLIPSLVFHGGADYDEWSLRCVFDNNYEYKLLDECYSLLVDTEEQVDWDRSIVVSPNPATETINLINRTTSELRSAKIYSMSGACLFESQLLSEPIPIGDLSPGFYLIVVEGENGLFRQKFVKS